MVQAPQKSFGVREAYAQHRSQPCPALHGVGCATEPRLRHIRGGKNFPRFPARRPNLIQCGANRRGRSLLDANIIVCRRFLPGNKSVLCVGKALSEKTANTFPCRVRIGQNNNPPTTIGFIYIIEGAAT